MMRWSAQVVGLALTAVLFTGCKEKAADEVAQVPEDGGSTLADLAPMESTASSMMPVEETPSQPAASLAPPSEPPAGSPNVHVVQPKETLYSLAVRYYSDGKQWTRILDANKARISDPTKVPVGTKLIIP